MADDEQVTRQSKVVVETPTANREVTTSRTTIRPEPSNTSSAAIAAMVILAVAVVGLLALLFWSMKTNSDNANLAAQQQPTPQTIIQQPAQQPPVIVQQPAPATQPAPIIVNPPAPAADSNSPGGIDDATIQADIDRKLQSDSTLSMLDVTASVLNGKVLLIGKVSSDQLKSRIEKSVRTIKGVKSVDNQITIAST